MSNNMQNVTARIYIYGLIIKHLSLSGYSIAAKVRLWKEGIQYNVFGGGVEVDFAYKLSQLVFSSPSYPPGESLWTRLEGRLGWHSCPFYH